MANDHDKFTCGCAKCEEAYSNYHNRPNEAKIVISEITPSVEPEYKAIPMTPIENPSFKEYKLDSQELLEAIDSHLKHDTHATAIVLAKKRDAYEKKYKVRFE